MASSETKAAEGGDPIADVLEDSVAYSLVDDAWRMLKINDLEAKYFKKKYREMYEVLHGIETQEKVIIREKETVESEILAEKIEMEKTVVDENDASRTLRKLEEQRAELQKELEFTEQKDTMVKFELEELKRVHEELTEAHKQMKQKNVDTVEPVLTALRKENDSLIKQLQKADDNFDKETANKQLLKARCGELESQAEEKKAALDTKNQQIKVASGEPPRLQRQCEAVTNAGKTMERENNELTRKFREFDDQIEKQRKRRAEAEKVKASLNEKIELNLQTIEKRDEEVSIIRSTLEATELEGDDLNGQKVELNIKRKEVESNARHNIDKLTLTKKSYHDVMRLLKKKKSFMEGVKAVLPSLQEQLKGSELTLKTLQSEKVIKTREVLKLKDELDSFIADFLQQEGIEADKKKELESAIADVDEQEAKVMHALTETKTQGKLIQVLSAQRDIVARDFARMDFKEKEARKAVKMKELSVLDLTKRCTELSNRLKEFTALYEVVKNERNKYVSLLQGSTQAAAEMKEKIRILGNEVEILGNESTAKDLALSKEKGQHLQAQNHRNALRQDMNRLLSEYRSKQGMVEQQIMEIDKLNVMINTLEKDMLELKRQYERSVEERNVTGVQLIDRNDELCILYERSNQQQEALRKGELLLMKKDHDLRQIRLQTDELKRQYTTAKHRLPEKEVHSKRIEEVEDGIAEQQKQIEDLSSRLENPSNSNRWRELDGEDPSSEQLMAKVQVLEARLDDKREVLLEKELVLEEVTALIERLKKQAYNKRDSSKALATELNELQGKIRDTTKLMLASVSELSMYQATALRLQQEKMTREKALEEARWKLDHGEAPTEDAVKTWNRNERKRLAAIETAIRREEEYQEQPDGKSTVRTAAEPRPNAYIPDDMGIPKPYGNLAPFKPTEAGSTMRHIKPVVPKAIEI
jgi:chromosome segregation ATPase